MRPTDWRIAGTLVAGLAAALLATAAESVKLNVKPGLWEIASQAEISGPPPLSDDMLAKLTPDQRAKFEAAMQASMANAAKPHLAKHCVTPEKIARGLDVERHDNQSCQKKFVSNSNNEMEFSETCTEQSGTTTIDEHIQLSSGEQLTGTINVIRNSGGKTMTVNSTIHGQWLGASCGDIKDFELEK